MGAHRGKGSEGGEGEKVGEGGSCSRGRYGSTALSQATHCQRHKPSCACFPPACVSCALPKTRPAAHTSACTRSSHSGQDRGGREEAPSRGRSGAGPSGGGEVGLLLLPPGWRAAEFEAWGAGGAMGRATCTCTLWGFGGVAIPQPMAAFMAATAGGGRALGRRRGGAVVVTGW